MGLIYPNISFEAAASNFARISAEADLYGTDWVTRQMTTILQKELEGTKVLSMSRRWNNMAMWAKYASDHTGYCLEFANEGMFAEARAVEYMDVLPLDIKTPRAGGADFFFQKTDDWSNEQEVRLVVKKSYPSRLRFPPELLTRIVLGKSIPPRGRDVILSWARKRKPPLRVDQGAYDAIDHVLTTTTIYSP